MSWKILFVRKLDGASNSLSISSRGSRKRRISVSGVSQRFLKLNLVWKNTKRSLCLLWEAIICRIRGYDSKCMRWLCTIISYLSHFHIEDKETNPKYSYKSPYTEHYSWYILQASSIQDDLKSNLDCAQHNERLGEEVSTHFKTRPKY